MTTSLQAFISYAREDFDTALRLYKSLEGRRDETGVSAWLDRQRLLPGMDWEREITRALEASSFVIVVISESSMTKEGYVQKEIRRALDRLSTFPPGKIFLIPVRIDNTIPTHDELRRIHWVDLLDDWDLGVEQVIAAFAHSRRTMSTPPTRRPVDRSIEGVWQVEGSVARFEITFRGDQIMLKGWSELSNKEFEVTNVQWDGEILSGTFFFPLTSFTTYSELRLIDANTISGIYRGDSEGTPEVWRRVSPKPN